jgi:flagellar secretion chaperone FliS
MPNKTYDRYLEAEVLNADPLKLVRLLYRGAIEATGAARRHLASGAIRERSLQIMKAWRILHELAQSLDHQRGGEISPALARLYAYMQTRLIEANSRQADAPLAEVEALLGTLCEAWQSVKPVPPPEAYSYQPISCSY